MVITCHCLLIAVFTFFFKENLAIDKPVTVSKRYNNKSFDPSHAVDGDVSTDLLKCSLTASGEKGGMAYSGPRGSEKHSGHFFSSRWL